MPFWTQVKSISLKNWYLPRLRRRRIYQKSSVKREKLVCLIKVRHLRPSIRTFLIPPWIEIMQKIGQLFLLRTNINSVGSVLDSPVGLWLSLNLRVSNSFRCVPYLQEVFWVRFNYLISCRPRRWTEDAEFPGSPTLVWCGTKLLGDSSKNQFVEHTGGGEKQVRSTMVAY